MNLKWRRELETKELVVELRITPKDMVEVELDKFDRLLLTDCESSGASIADRILGLVTLCRRIENV